jgi:hypothetical protein
MVKSSSSKRTKIFSQLRSRLIYKFASVFLTLQFLFLPFSQQAAYAFDAEKTHRPLTRKALELKIKEHKATGDEEFLKAFGNINEQGELTLTPNADKIIDGSEEEDYPEPGTLSAWVSRLLGGGVRSIPHTTPDFNWQNQPFMYHFYNPKTKKGLFGIPDTEAPGFANAYTYNAVKYYQGANCQPPNYEKAFYVLGRAFCGLGFGLGFALAYSLVLKGRISLPLCSTIIAAAFRTSLLTASLTCASHPTHEGLKNLTYLKCFDFFNKPSYNFLIPLNG